MIVLTGATGFLGMELLVRLLDRTDADIACLIRARDDAAARERLDGVLELVVAPEHRPAAARRVRAVAADLEAPGPGLRALAADATHVVHCAASVQFTLPHEDAWRINVGGTEAMLGLCQAAPNLDRFVHVSTAYVAGERDAVCREDEGDVGQTHRNTYEATKLAAEGVVEASGVPHCTLRPSIVVGDSQTGWTPAFNVIYQPVQAFARGLFKTVPADPDANLDIVPIDVVADALHELTVGPRQDGTFHAVAGAHAATAREVADLAVAAFDKPAPQWVPPGSAPEIEVVAGAFLPYFTTRTRFDGGRGIALAGRETPRFETYFDVLMDQARAARWGKVRVRRWSAEADQRASAA